VLDADVVLEPGFADQLRGWILNPGCLYEFIRHRCWAEKGKALIRTGSRMGDNDLRDPDVFCSIFNVRARLLRLILDGGAISAGLWPADKRVDLHAFLLQPDPLAERRRLGEAFAGQALAVWRALQACGYRIALFGAGHHTKWLLELVDRFGMRAPVVILDDNLYTYEVGGVPVKRPEVADTASFDAVVVSADPGRMTRILTGRCRELWDDKTSVVTLYQALPEGRFMKVDPAGLLLRDRDREGDSDLMPVS